LARIQILKSTNSKKKNPRYIVYENNPQTIGELKAAITAKIREIP
jgi:hypothetical protein